MTRRSEQARQQLIGMAVLALGALLLVIAFTGGVPGLGGASGRTVIARFAEANLVDNSTPVRVGGVDVGRVGSINAAPGNTTDVGMSITDSGVRVHRDASAQIRWRTLLGGAMYIDLHPGSPSAPALIGPIQLSRTSSQVDWDEFNNQLPTSARLRMRQELKGFAAGLSAPTAEGRTLAVFGPALQTIGLGADATRGHDIGDLAHLVHNSAAVMRALSASQSLAALVDGADRTLAVTAAHNVALAQTIQLSPPALEATQRTDQNVNQILTDLDALAPRLDPGARLLGPATALLKPMLSQTERALADARPLLVVAPRTLTALGAAGTEGVPLLAGLTPMVKRLNGNLIPFLARPDPDTRLKLYETLGPIASALSSSMGGFTANGYVYNFNVQLNSGSAVLPCDAGPNGTSNLQSCIAPTPPYALPKGKR